MNFWDTITGNDMNREFEGFEVRVKALPSEYQAAWAEVVTQLFPYGNFTGRNLMPILDGVLGLLEETADDGQSISDVLGDDIPAFCAALVGGQGARTFRDKWRDQLNRNVARRLAQLKD
jgi:DNA-binding ferritin-like protein (Dps family)